MSFRWVRSGLVVALALAALNSCAPAPAGAGSQPGVEALLAEGDQAAREERWADAWRAYSRAQTRAPSSASAAQKVNQAERVLRSRGLLRGDFDYTTEFRKGDAGVGGFEWVLLGLHLAAAGAVLAVWVRRGPSAAAPLALGLLLVLAPWGQGGRVAGAVFGRGILVCIVALTTLWPRRAGASAREAQPAADATGWPGFAPVAVVAGVAALAAAFSPDRASARDGLTHILWLAAALLVSARIAAWRPGWPRALVLWFTAAAALPAALTLLQRALVVVGFDLRSAAAPFRLARDGRAAADFLHPGHLGTFLLAAGLALAGAALFSVPVRRGALAGGGVLVALGLLQSARASLLALMAGGLLLLACGRSVRVRWAFGILLAAGIVVGCTAVVVRFSAGDYYAWTRFSLWRAGCAAIATRPVFGFGPGAYAAFSPNFQGPAPNPESISRFGRLALGPHSDLLGAPLAFGLVGGLIVGVALVSLVRRALAALSVTREADPWAPGVAAALAALVAHGLVDDFLLVRPAAGVAAALLLGTLVGHAAPVADEAAAGKRPSRSRRWLVTVALSVALVFGDALPWLADALARSGRPAAAARVDPFGMGYWIAAARTAVGEPTRRLAQAYDSVSRATELVPLAGRPWLELAQVHESAVRGLLPTDDTLSAAIAAWTRALERVPHDVQARRARARLLAHSGDLRSAVRDFRRAIADEPNYLGARLDLVRVLRQAGDEAGARVQLDELRLLAARLDVGRAGNSYEVTLLTLAPDERAEVFADR